MYSPDAGYAKTYCAKSHNWYNVHISNEQCQDVKKQISVLAREYLFLCGLIGRMPLNERALLASAHCELKKSEEHMKINYYRDEALADDRVDVYYRKKNARITNLMAYLESEQVLYGRSEGEQRRLYLNEIYYVEVVERHCFAYLKSGVWEIDETLRSFLARYQESGFLQIGKAAAVNMNHIEKIVPDLNMRMHLTLENGERLVLSRAFKKEFMEYLKQKKEERR